MANVLSIEWCDDGIAERASYWKGKGTQNIKVFDVIGGER